MSCEDESAFYLQAVKISCKKKLQGYDLDSEKSHFYFCIETVFKNKIKLLFCFKADQPSTDKSFLSIYSFHLYSKE